MNVGLRIKRQFQNGKALYMPKVSSTDPDAFVPDDHWQAWPAETLANRLKHDFVAWEPVPEAGRGSIAAARASQSRRKPRASS